MSDEKFADFQLQLYLLTATQKTSFRQSTPVQQQVIPVTMAGQSVVGQSATGSGKTHAFLLLIFSKINLEGQTVQAVITTLSRELAYQIYNATKQLNRYAPHPLTIHNYVGGTDKQHQVDQLSRKQPRLVIGTPGRVLDLTKSQVLDIHTAKMFMVDEADITLDMGFLHEVDQIVSHFPDDLQMMVFSAAISQKLRPFLKKYMENPVIEEIPTEAVINPDVGNWLMSTKGQDRNQLIYRLLTLSESYLALVFVNTKERVVELIQYLKNQGLKVAMIHGGLEARRRKRTVRQTHDLECQYVVATDLAARGIDIDGVSLVISDDLPIDLEYFVHRVGRTGRNGIKGTVITLYELVEDDLIAKLEKRGVKFVPEKLKNGQLVTTHDHNRRKHYKRWRNELDPSMRGYVKKTKKKVKPGYKKRIKKAIKEDEQQERKLELRHKIRKAKHARQKQHRRERNAR